MRQDFLRDSGQGHPSHGRNEAEIFIIAILGRKTAILGGKIAILREETTFCHYREEHFLVRLYIGTVHWGK